MAFARQGEQPHRYYSNKEPTAPLAPSPAWIYAIEWPISPCSKDTRIARGRSCYLKFLSLDTKNADRRRGRRILSPSPQSGRKLPRRFTYLLMNVSYRRARTTIVIKISGYYDFGMGQMQHLVLCGTKQPRWEEKNFQPSKTWPFGLASNDRTFIWRVFQTSSCVEFDLVRKIPGIWFLWLVETKLHTCGVDSVAGGWCIFVLDLGRFIEVKVSSLQLHKRYLWLKTGGKQDPDNTTYVP